MTAIEEQAREALADYEKTGHLWDFEPQVVRDLAASLRALLDERLSAGSCWDEGPTIPVPDGQCAPMPPHCELVAGHLGAHRSGRTEWMRRDPYNTVLARAEAAEAALAALSVPPSDDEREALRDELAGWVIGAGYYQSMVGTSDAAEMADAILAAGFRRQGPITDARPWRPEDGDTRCQVCGRRNPVWWANNDDWNALMPDDGILCPSCYHSRWLEAAERVRSAAPSTTEQEQEQ